MQQGASQQFPPLPNVRVIPNLNVDVLLLMSKLPNVRISGIQYLASDGKVFVFGNSQDTCAEAFVVAYEKVIQTLKSTNIPVQAEYPQEKVTCLVANYNRRYNRCHFSFDEQNRTIKIISASSRQFEQTKRFLMDIVCRGVVPQTIQGFTFVNGRTLTVKRGNIVDEKCTYIVNATNSQLYGHKAGAVGRVKCEFLLLAVGPDIPVPGVDNERCYQIIQQATTSALYAAQNVHAVSIAFPSLSTGLINGVSHIIAANAMIDAMEEFNYRKPTVLTDIRIVITDVPTYTWYAQEVVLRHIHNSGKPKAVEKLPAATFVTRSDGRSATATPSKEQTTTKVGASSKPRSKRFK